MTIAEALPLTESVLKELIGTIGVVLVAAIGVLSAIVAKQNKSIKTVRNHVENSHIDAVTGEPYNLRDNIDDNQKELLREIRGVRVELGRVDQRVIAVEGETRSLRHELGDHIEWSRGQEDRIDSHEGRLGHMETTLNPKEQ